jgi:hypothetical protein
MLALLQSVDRTAKVLGETIALCALYCAARTGKLFRWFLVGAAGYVLAAEL